jgi:hypothetical protein
MDVLPGVAPVTLFLARTEDTVVGLTDVRGYPDGFAFLLRVRWRLVADPGHVWAEPAFLGRWSWDRSWPIVSPNQGARRASAGRRRMRAPRNAVDDRAVLGGRP